MKSLPVIGRELRSEARQPFTYWMRVFAVVIALGFPLLGLPRLWTGLVKGNEFFDWVQPVLFSLIWLFGPILTCDSISRERRDGTLGLLMLTSLRPVDIALAKACAGIIRLASVVMAIFPVLALPLLMGGVSGSELLRAALTNAMALLAAIGAGLLASTRCRQFNRAALLSLAFAVIALLLLGSVQTLVHFLRGAFPPFTPQQLFFVLLMGPWVLCAGITDAWRAIGNSPVYLYATAFQVLLAALFLFGVLLYLNRHLRRLSCESGRSPRQEAWWKLLCTPRLFNNWLRSRQHWILQRNPIGWLHCRTWSARISAWGWLGVAVLVETTSVTGAIGGDLSDFRNSQLFLCLLATIGLAFSASDSFRLERETGALELLLVTPLGVRQIIIGRLLGIYGQFFLVFGLLVSFWCLSSNWVRYNSWFWTNSFFSGFAVHWGVTALVFLSTYLAVPIIGLYQSLVRRHFMTSWMMTLLLGFIVPVLVPLGFCSLPLSHGIGLTYQHLDSVLIFGILLQLGFGIAAAKRIYIVLSQRSFALGVQT